MKNLIIRKLAKVHRIEYVSPNKADGQIKKIYDQANKELGLAADPLLLHSGSADFLELFYTLGREILLVKNNLARITKDFIATVVSKENKCPYCEDVHTISVNSIDNNISFKPLFNDRANSRREQKSIMDLLKEKFDIDLSAEGLEEAYSVILYFHYTNRMVNVFVDGTHLPDNFLGKIYEWLGKVFLRKYVNFKLQTGLYNTVNQIGYNSYDWIHKNQIIKNRLISMDEYLSDRIHEILSADLISLLQQMLSEWDGQPMPLSGKWLTDSLRKINEENKDIATLMLLVAFASYRVTDELINTLIKKGFNNSAILFITGWSALEAAKRKIDLLKNVNRGVSHEVFQ